MKKTIVIIFLFVELFCSAQSLINENKMWSNIVVGTEANSSYVSYFIKFERDTNNNEEQYNFIMRSDEQNHENWYRYGLIIEDSINELVYLYDKSSKLKTLLYDFSLEEGDSIEYKGQYYSVDSVRYKTIGSINEPYKHIYFDNSRYWIKGIGSPRGVLEGLSGLPLSTGATLNLICYYEDGELVYQNSRYNDCYVNSNTSVTNFEDQAKLIEVFSSDVSMLTIRISNNQQGEFTLFNLEGQKILQQNINAIETQLCLPQSGVFIYQFVSKKGEVQTGKVNVK